MTEPTPPDPWEPFTTRPELARWLQLPDISEEQWPFAELVTRAVGMLIREYGSKYWTYENVPPRVKLFADLKAKNFVQHPTGAISETTGPLSERFIEDVVRELDNFTDAEKSMLASYSGDDDPLTPAEVKGLWALSTTRGPLETHQGRAGVITVPYWRVGSKSIPYYAEGALGSPDGGNG